MKKEIKNKSQQRIYNNKGVNTLSWVLYHLLPYCIYTKVLPLSLEKDSATPKTKTSCKIEYVSGEKIKLLDNLTEEQEIEILRHHKEMTGKSLILYNDYYNKSRQFFLDVFNELYENKVISLDFKNDVYKKHHKLKTKYLPDINLKV